VGEVLLQALTPSHFWCPALTIKLLSSSSFIQYSPAAHPTTGEAEVVGAAQALLQALAPFLGPVVQAHGAGSGAEEDDNGAEGEGAGPLPAGATAAAAAAAGAAARLGQAASVAGSSLAGYAAQLVLALLEAAAKRELAAGAGAAAAGGAAAAAGAAAAGGGAVVDLVQLPLVVRVAQGAPDAAVRNGALSLLAVLAGARPEAVLEHVLEVRAGWRCGVKVWGQAVQEG